MMRKLTLLSGDMRVENGQNCSLFLRIAGFAVNGRAFSVLDAPGGNHHALDALVRGDLEHHIGHDPFHDAAKPAGPDLHIHHGRFNGGQELGRIDGCIMADHAGCGVHYMLSQVKYRHRNVEGIAQNHRVAYLHGNVEDDAADGGADEGAAGTGVAS